MKKSEHLWKSMKAGLRSGYNGEKWEIGKWKKIKGEPELCENGYHASENIIDAMRYTSLENLAQVEVRGECDKDDDKQVWTEMCVVRAWKWKKEDSVALAVYAAELVIDKFEAKYPDDKRPRQAIEAAKAWLKNPTKKNREAAAVAAAEAAGDASASARAAVRAARAAAGAASAAAWGAARAARDAACAAAWAVTRAAWAAWAAEGIKDKCHQWILDRVESLEETTGEKE